MASNAFGNVFRITTWGESHGRAIGVVIDGCPAGVLINEEEIQRELQKRAPGRTDYVTPRKESDSLEILSGVYEGETTGAPISIIIYNENSNSDHYEPIKGILRPGHANFTYLQKYGIFDYRGGGRASARETACRVAAAAVARKILIHFGVEVLAFISEVGGEKVVLESDCAKEVRHLVESSPIFCPDSKAASAIIEKIASAKKVGDSLGGIVDFRIYQTPKGLGDPVYEKVEANLAKALLSIPAAKGFEFGEGFASSKMRGSDFNDPFYSDEGKIKTRTNHAGGLLGGITTGMPIFGRVSFKPTSSIQFEQESVDLRGNQKKFCLPKGSRHDPCVAIRAVPVVEAMCALVIVDCLLMNRISRL